MITVTFEESGNHFSLQVKGHAGYAEVGKDIVCSSASILACTVAQFIMEAEHNGDLTSPPLIRLECGDTLVSCEANDCILTGMQDMFAFAKIGYMLLEHNYSQYVKVNTLT